VAGILQAQINPAPSLKGAVGVDFIPNLLIATLALTAPAALPIGQGVYASAPTVKYQPKIDPLPNVTTSTLSLIAPAAIPPGSQQVATNPLTKFQVFCDEPYPNVILRGITILPVTAGQTDWPSAPSVKYQPKIEPALNLIATTFSLPAYAALPIGSRLDASAPPPKYKVQCDQVISPLLYSIAPAPLFRQLDWTRTPAAKYQVQVDRIPNLLETLLTVPFTPPFVPVPWPSTPRVIPNTTADMFVVTYQPTVTVSPQTGPALIMPAPALKRAVEVDVTTNSIPLLLATTQPATLPIGKQLDWHQAKRKYEVTDLNSLWPNSRVLSIPNAPTVPFTPALDVSRQQIKFNVYDLNYLWPNSQLPHAIPAPPTPPFVITGVTRPGGRVILNPKKQGETIPEAFNFISSLGAGETIASAVCTCTVYSGTDPHPSSLIDGATSISGTVATQGITGGIVGVMYELLMTATTSLGNIIEISAYLAIEPDLPG
jgi:hypothetical protein